MRSAVDDVERAARAAVVGVPIVAGRGSVGHVVLVIDVLVMDKAVAVVGAEAVEIVDVFVLVLRQRQRRHRETEKLWGRCGEVCERRRWPAAPRQRQNCAVHDVATIVSPEECCCIIYLILYDYLNSGGVNNSQSSR
ncbi:hypothetical protein V1508DRAFT_418593 [Lipomyces doorenjongii]|uniref:uncharacterized protein n=1 Tax=Lipomyces doorenjongii TaxID=383834 RepID=UPI0034CE6F17